MSLLLPLLDQYRNDASLIIREAIIGHGERSVVLFGGGYQGRLTLSELRAMGLASYVRCFMDNHAAKWGTELEGVPVWGPSALADLPRDTPILITAGNHAPIRQQLAEAGFITGVRVIDASGLRNGLYDRGLMAASRERIDAFAHSLGDERSREVLSAILAHRLTGEIQHVTAVCEDLQYFPEDLVRLKQDEIFIDGGAYDGDTLKAFLAACEEQFEEVHAFEPDRRNFEKLRSFVAGHTLRDRIHLHGQALYSHCTELRFDEGPEMSSKLDDSGGTSIEAVSVDDVLAGNRASFIKFDLEGAEKHALSGAERTIRQWRPKLAISVYHLADDLWSLPEQIRAMTPGYHYHLRHYSCLTFETILYAIPSDLA